MALEDFSKNKDVDTPTLASLSSEAVGLLNGDQKIVSVEVEKALEAAAQSPEREKTRQRFGQELEAFANKTNVSENLKTVQDLVKTYNQSEDKDAAARKFGPGYLRWEVATGKKSAELFKEIAMEANNSPERRGLDQKYDEKADAYYDQLQKLPPSERNRIMDLSEMRSGETLEQKDQRVRDALESMPKVLAAFDEMSQARKNIQDSMTPRERQLREEAARNYADLQLAKAIRNTVFLHSQL